MSNAPTETVRRGFLAAAAYNACIVVVTKGFTNQVLFDADPTVWSAPSSMLVLLWGAAYLSLSRSHVAAPWTVLVFAVEKAFYVAVWLRYLMAPDTDLSALWAVDPLTSLFMATFGVGDGVFCLFFAWVFLGLRKRSS